MSVEPVTDANAEVVELTIRCALQTFDDKAIRAPIDWMVEQLKQHLYEVCATKPEPKRQRLIYAGHCLKDHQTLREILNRRCEGLEQEENRGPQVIHLVCAPKEAPQMATGVRRRPNATPIDTTNVAAGQPTNAYMNFAGIQTQNTNYFAGLPSNVLPQNVTPEQLAYYANWMGYQQALTMNYYQQMMAPQMMMGIPQFFPMTGQAIPGYNMLNVQNMQQMPNVPQMDQNNNVVNAPPAPAANDEEHLNDIVGILYKSIRVGFFLMVLFFYSSMERFLAVFLIMCILWFVHRRREQNQLNEAARRVVQQPAAAHEEERPPNNDNNNNEIPAQVVEPPPVVVQPDAQTRWNLVWSAVSTFFMSLIPEHHQIPVDVAE